MSRSSTSRRARGAAGSLHRRPRRPAAPHVEVFESMSGAWFYRTVGANGETENHSEAFTRKADAVRAGKALIANPPTRLEVVE